MGNEFRFARALGLSFRSWGKNFIPFTVLSAVLFSPALIMILTSNPVIEGDGEAVVNRILLWPAYAVIGFSTLIAPMLTYRVIQELNGTKASMLDSVRFGLRGVVPSIILAVITNILQHIPVGGIIGAVIMCTAFVAGPAAVAERLDPITAFKRSAELTKGHRWGIFGLTFIIGLALVGLLFLWIQPVLSRTSADDVVATLRSSALVFSGVLGVLQIFTGIVQAVSYALLRGEKDGVSHEELARVFD